MVHQREMKKGKKNRHTLCSTLQFRPDATDENEFSRADLVFNEVDHSNISYEVRVFLNQPKADEKTPRKLEEGYAGRFVVFGHGGCFGDIGHCEIPTGPRAAHDLRPQHPLTPQTKIVTITNALKYILQEQGAELKNVTLVPFSKDPLKKNRKPNEKLLKFESMELRTYR